MLSTIKDIYLFDSCWNLLDIRMRLQSLQSWREVQLFDILPENVGCSALGWAKILLLFFHTKSEKDICTLVICDIFWIAIKSAVLWEVGITKIITWAKLMKNIWSLVYFCRPGKACSVSPAISLLRNFLYARKPSLRPPLSAMFSPCVLMPFNFGWNEINVYKILKKLFYDIYFI